DLLPFGFQIGQERELREKFLRRLELKRETRELFEIFETRAIVGKIVLQIILVAGFENMANHPRRTMAHRLGFNLRNSDAEIGPGCRRLFWNDRGTLL